MKLFLKQGGSLCNNKNFISAFKHVKKIPFSSLSNTHVFKFAFGYLLSYHTAFKTHKMLSHTTKFSNFPGVDCPRSPLQARALGARLVRLLVGSHAPAKKKPPTGLNSQSRVRKINAWYRFGDRPWSYTFKGAFSWGYLLANSVYVLSMKGVRQLPSHVICLFFFTFSIDLPSISILI